MTPPSSKLCCVHWPEAAMPVAGHTAQLGQWASEVRWKEAPEEVAEALRSSLLFNLSLARASIEAETHAQQALAAVLTSQGDVPAWRTGAPLCASAAAALNAALITARGQNDTLAQMNGHPGCVVWPAVLALARERQLPADAVMSAALAGYEVSARAAGGQAHAVAARGWRCTSVYGTLGAAAACARLLGLDGARAAHALGIAAQCAAGTMQCYVEGTPEWIWQVASASRTGVEAALLAQQGFTACAQALEGTHGLHRALTGGEPPGPAAQWTLGQLSLKAFPGCAINQSAVHLLRELQARDKRKNRQVASVTLWLHAEQARHPGVALYGPFDSPAGAFMSAPFMLAAMLENETIRWSDFNEQQGAGAVHARSRRVRVEADDTVPRFGCRLELTCTDGSQVRGEAGASAGVPARWANALQISHALLTECGAPQRGDANVKPETLAAAVNAFSADAGSDVAGLLACAELE
jgi:2-methylcitrate dehydratase PrpD